MPAAKAPPPASLAANSARYSLKRTRLLYDVDAASVFLPAVDPVIRSASVNRRRRRRPTTETATSDAAASNNNSTALVVAKNNNDSSTTMQPLASENTPQPTSGASTSLVQFQEDTQDKPKPGGILVVRSSCLSMRLFSMIGKMCCYGVLSHNTIVMCRAVICSLFHPRRF